MPISTESIIQTNTGGANATSTSVSLSAGTTLNNTVIVLVSTLGATAPGSILLAGFVRDVSQGIWNSKAIAFRRSRVPAAETSWTLSGFGSAQSILWVAMEVNGLDQYTPLDISGLAGGNGITVENPTTTGGSAYGTLEIALHAGTNIANNTVPVWTGHTNDFEPWVTGSFAEATKATGCTVSIKISDDVLGNNVAGSSATSSVTVDGEGLIVRYAIEEAKRRQNYDVMSGFEFGTVAGMALGNTGVKIVDTVAGTPAVVSTTPRTGTYCLELASSAAIENVTWTAAGALSMYAGPLSGGVMRVCVYFPSALPSTDVELFAVGTTSGVTVRYRTASQSIGVQVVGVSPSSSGTEQLSATTVVADQWYGIDVFLDGRGTVTWTAYWQLDGVEQTPATLAQTVAASVATLRLGWGASTTATVRYDDVAFSRVPANYPIGDVKIYPLKVDPAGTPTVTLATSFSTMTANGTLNSTFSVTTARDAIDDIPPVLGASADGFVQDTAGTNEYVEFPMETRDAIGNLQSIRCVRWYFCGWAASATAATIGFKAVADGTLIQLLGTQDPQFDNTSTPAWVSLMMRTTSSADPFPWTQVVLDDLRCRIGFAGDVSPVIGVHAVLAELAMRTPVTKRVEDNSGATVDLLMDPDSGYTLAAILTAPAGSAAAAQYIVRGVTIDRTATAGTTDQYIVDGVATEDLEFVSAWPTP